MEVTNDKTNCPICDKAFPIDIIDVHVNRCLFLHATEEDSGEKKKEPKRGFSAYKGSPTAELKKPRLAGPFTKSPKTTAATSVKTASVANWSKGNASTNVQMLSDDENDGNEVNIERNKCTDVWIELISNHFDPQAEVTISNGILQVVILPLVVNIEVFSGDQFHKA